MEICVKGRKNHSEIRVISSKSYVHRYLIAAALSEDPVMVYSDVFSDDLKTTAECLRMLGAQIEIREDGFLIRRGGLREHGLQSQDTGRFSKDVEPCTRDALHCCGRQADQEIRIDCAESGTTARFMLALVAALGITAELTGGGRLSERPVEELIDELNVHGAGISGKKLPIRIDGRLTGGEYRIPGNVSSQYISGLLMALPLLREDSRIILTTELQSESYVEMTLEVLKKSGIRILRQEDGSFVVPGGQKYRVPAEVKIEGDWTAGALLLAMGTAGCGIIVAGLDADSIQGDRKILEILKNYGADVTLDSIGRSGAAEFCVRMGCRKAVEADVSHIPDLVPVLAVLAAAGEGVSVFHHVERLHLKESDRVEACLALVRALERAAWTEITDGSEDLYVRGSAETAPAVPVRIDGSRDHRIVMAAAVASEIFHVPVIVSDAEAVSKSWPGFWELFQVEDPAMETGGIDVIESVSEP